MEMGQGLFQFSRLHLLSSPPSLPSHLLLSALFTHSGSTGLLLNPEFSEIKQSSLPERKESICPYKVLYGNISSSFICSHPKLETTTCSPINK